MKTLKPWPRNHWAQCNFYRNPFGELTREERAELAVVDTDSLIESLGEHHSAIQLVGGCGRGKTTRLLKLSARLPDSSYTYLPEDGPCPPIPDGAPIIIDEAQRLPRQVADNIFSLGRPLILSTHRRLNRRLVKFGYQVHTQSIGKANTAELLRQVLNLRIEASRLNDRPVPTVSTKFAQRLVHEFGTDFRAIECYLYDLFQCQVIEHGQVRFDD